MEVAYGLVSYTLAKLFLLSGLSKKDNAQRSKKMEEKALEVYGN